VKRNLTRGLWVVLIATIAGALTSLPATADSPCGGLQALNCSAGNGGIYTGLGSQELARSRQGLDITTGAPESRSYGYASVYDCQFNTPGAIDILCAGAIQACAGNTPQQGQGPQVRLYRRELDAAGKQLTGWVVVGTTCLADQVPGQPVLGMGQILAAFHNTPWAKPTVHIQPEGNLTLVTLPTYFAVTWPAAGYQPGEADTLTMLGHQVQIRPTLQSYTYVFGDGTTIGPTTSPGGPYPGGDITHTYPKAGLYDTRIDVTFGGEFTLDGGPWIPIPDTVPVPGPLQPLTVTTARSRLVIR
jgi:hypothetical protein